MEMFRLRERADDFPYKLSGGEKQAVNLIRTLCTPCSLALIDEVLASLHHDLRARAKTELASWLDQRKRTALLVTHDPDDLDLPFTRFFAINGGTVHEVGRGDVVKMLENGV